jgi:hypothetical protein
LGVKGLECRRIRGLQRAQTECQTVGGFSYVPTYVGFQPLRFRLPSSRCWLHRSTLALWGRGSSPDRLRALAQAKLSARGSQILRDGSRCILLSCRIFYTFPRGLGSKYSKFRMERWRLAPVPPAWANSSKGMVFTSKSAAEEGGCDGCPAEIAHNSWNPGFQPVAEFPQLALPPRRKLSEHTIARLHKGGSKVCAGAACPCPHVLSAQGHFSA